MKREDALKQANEQLTKKLGMMEEVREAAWFVGVALSFCPASRELLCFEALHKGSHARSA